MDEKRPQFYTKAAVLDSLADVRQPSPEIADLVADLVLEDVSLAHYFFRDLDNAAWLEPLYVRGVFRQPPPVEERPTDTGIAYQFPRWAAGTYLIRMASVRPEIVVKVALELDTDNASALLALIQATTQMPPSSAAQVAPAVVRWLSTSKHWIDMLAEGAQKLMVYLAEHEEAEAALVLLEALTEPEVEEASTEVEEQRYVWREARTRYRPWYLSKLIEDRLPKLSKLDPLAIVSVLETQLRKVIEIEGRGVEGEDSSYIWRPAIEDHPQNWGHHRLDDLLTVGVRDSLERAVSDNPKGAQPTIERYLSDPLSVFRRLALHLIRLGRQHYQKLLLEVVQAREFLDDSAVHHEFSVLIHECFPELAEGPKRTFLDMVVAGPTWEGESGLQLDESHWRYWVLRRLWMVREHLKPPYDSRFKDLLDQFGEPEHPDFLAWHDLGWVGPASPKDKGDLAKMSAREVLEFLGTFEPSGEPFDHSREGLARHLEAVVKEKPEEYAAIAPDFVSKRVHSTYVYHLVRGFHEAWKDGKELDWEGILALSDPISLALTDDALGLVEAPPEIDDIGWSSVRAAIARFFAGALQRDDRALPQRFMPRVRDILLRFMLDPEPTPEDERKCAESAMDWVNVRINFARGVAASALLEYALRCARLHKAEHQAGKDTGAHPCRFEPEVKAAFNNMLDKSEEPSAAVHSIFGQYLPNFLYLDHDWTMANLDKIFPPEPEKQSWWEAAWQAYVVYSRPFYRGVYELLRPQYREAIQAMARGEFSPALQRTQQPLAYHLALAYRLGLEPLEPVSAGRPIGFVKPETEGSLLDAFLESASDELRAIAVRALGRELRSDKPTGDNDWQRLREYWEARTVAAQTAPSSRAFDQELSAFSSWLEGAPEGLDALAPFIGPTIDHLVVGHEGHEVLDYLSNESGKHPVLAVGFLKRLLDRLEIQDDMYLFGAEGQIRTILRNALTSDETGRREAISVINVLGERGQYHYRDLLTHPEVH